MKNINIKSFLLFTVSSILLIYNVYLITNIIEKRIYQSKRSGVYREPTVDYNFYGKKCIPFSLISSDKKSFNIPFNKNIILIGLNMSFDKDKILVKYYSNMIKEFNCDVELIPVTSDLKIKDKTINYYYYDTKKLGEFLHLSDLINFTLLLDDNNIIRFFQYELVNPREFLLLIKRFEKTGQ